MFDQQQRKNYGWGNFVDEEQLEKKENSTFIVYKKEGQYVKEYPNGEIIPLTIEEIAKKSI